MDSLESASSAAPTHHSTVSCIFPFQRKQFLFTRLVPQTGELERDCCNLSGASQLRDPPSAYISAPSTNALSSLSSGHHAVPGENFTQTKNCPFYNYQTSNCDCGS